MHLALVNHLGLSLSWKRVVRLINRLDMTIVVDWNVKPQNKTTKTIELRPLGRLPVKNRLFMYLKSNMLNNSQPSDYQLSLYKQ